MLQTLITSNYLFLFMHIILATYNYYPFAWGGSEVYVHGLAKFLQNIGHSVTVIAAVGGEFTEPKPHKKIQTTNFDVFAYMYDGIEILGVHLKNETTEEVYSRYNATWIKDWQLILQESGLAQKNIDILHYNGFSSVVSVAIAEALAKEQAKNNFSKSKVLASYHTPISCPNGKLLYFREQACQIIPTATVCTACFIQAQKNMPIWGAKILANILPTQKIPIPQIPNAIYVKKFVGKSLQSFQKLDNQVDKWLVFSTYIQTVVEKMGVQSEKIRMLRHGIHEDFLTTQAQENSRNTDKDTFIYVGRFEKIKGFPTLLQAWLALPEQTEKRILQIVGDLQSNNEEIEQLIKIAKNRKDILFLGKKNAKEIKKLLQQATCMLIPSEWVEIGPLVLHEAIACGTNVLVSAIGGTGELAKFYGEGCTTFKMGNKKDLEDKILTFRYQTITHKVRSQAEHYTLVLEEYRRK
jgi:glycosyltransferase involved in cell wall biosynthesis